MFWEGGETASRLSPLPSDGWKPIAPAPPAPLLFHQTGGWSSKTGAFTERIQEKGPGCHPGRGLDTGSCQCYRQLDGETCGMRRENAQSQALPSTRQNSSLPLVPAARKASTLATQTIRNVFPTAEFHSVWLMQAKTLGKELSILTALSLISCLIWKVQQSLVLTAYAGQY